MLHSPGTKRRCAMPIPDEALLKMSLLGVELVWRQDRFVWQLLRVSDGVTLDVSVDGYETDWDLVLGLIADRVARGKLPPGWQNTQHVDTMPIEAAAVINEEAFPNE